MKITKGYLRRSGLLLLLVAGLRTAADCVPVPTGLVGWWPGEGTGDSSGAISGSIRGEVQVVDGHVGHALYVNGHSSALQLPSSFKLQSQEFSVEGWIRRTSTTQAGLDTEGGEIFAGSTNGFTFGLTHDGRLYGGQVGVVSFYSTSHITDTNWHHVAVTRVSGNVNYFADGSLVSTVPATPTFDLNVPYAIGGLGAPYANVYYGFLGDIDELSVYGRALTSSEISAIYQAGSAGKCANAVTTVDLPVTNPSFEALTGTNPSFFDSSGHLLLNHYSQFPGLTPLPIGFNTSNAIPGWNPHSPSGTINAGTINYRGSQYLPNGTSDGQNSVFINSTGYISQTLSNTFLPGQNYRLAVDVGAPVGVTFPGYFIGLYANGQLVAAGTNSVVVPAGGYATATIEITLPANSLAIGNPVEIRVGIPGNQNGQAVFDNVRLTATPVAVIVGSVPVVNPSFEALTGTDANYFDTGGKLLPLHLSEFPGYPIAPMGFFSTNAIPGWTGHASSGTINYTDAPYFTNAIPDGQNVVYINGGATSAKSWAAPIRQAGFITFPWM